MRHGGYTPTSTLGPPPAGEPALARIPHAPCFGCGVHKPINCACPTCSQQAQERTGLRFCEECTQYIAPAEPAVPARSTYWGITLWRHLPCLEAKVTRALRDQLGGRRAA